MSAENLALKAKFVIGIGNYFEPGSISPLDEKLYHASSTQEEYWELLSLLRKQHPCSLQDLERCILCIKNTPTPIKGYTLEHIINQSACDDHPILFNRIKNHPLNHVLLCRDHHDQIDNGQKGKGSHYQKTRDLNQLIQAAAYSYRAPEPFIKNLQRRQWINLFGLILDNIGEAVNEPSIPSKDLSNYYQIGKLISKSLYKWQREIF